MTPKKVEPRSVGADEARGTTAHVLDDTPPTIDAQAGKTANPQDHTSVCAAWLTLAAHWLDLRAVFVNDHPVTAELYDGVGRHVGTWGVRALTADRVGSAPNRHQPRPTSDECAKAAALFLFNISLSSFEALASKFARHPHWRSA